jgi:adenylosuccinate synthase
MIKHACDITGIDELCLTRLDTLKDVIIQSGNDQFPVCIAYATGNDENGYVIETDISWYDIDKYKPIYKMFKIWNNTDMYDKDFYNFIKYISEFVNVPIRFCSIGPNLDDIKTV